MASTRECGLESFIFYCIKLVLAFLYLIVVPLLASGPHRGRREKSNSLLRWARLFQFFLVASTAFSVLQIVNSKIFLQWLQTGMREMCTAISRTAWDTVMDIWLCLKMESTMSMHNCTFAVAGECRFSRITSKLSPCFNIPTMYRKGPSMQGERFIQRLVTP